MTKYITSTTMPLRKYEVVNKIPKGYQIWYIEKIYGYEDYLPLCQQIDPSDPDNYKIDLTTLKAIKLEKRYVKLILDNAHYHGLVMEEVQDTFNDNDYIAETAIINLDILTNIPEITGGYVLYIGAEESQMFQTEAEAVAAWIEYLHTVCCPK